jgi:hypothetical protein
MRHYNGQIPIKTTRSTVFGSVGRLQRQAHRTRSESLHETRNIVNGSSRKGWQLRVPVPSEHFVRAIGSYRRGTTAKMARDHDEHAASRRVSSRLETLDDNYVCDTHYAAAAQVDLDSSDPSTM